MLQAQSFWFVLLLVSAAAAAEQPSLAPVFTNAMVLQRDVPVPVWGTAAAGTSVTITLANQRKQTQADAKGKWTVTLDAMPASGEPVDLKVSTSDHTLILSDILVGEVWLAAGQSNMEWPLANEAHAKTELPLANHPQFRLLNLHYAGQNYSAKPFSPEILNRLTFNAFYRGAWHPCSPPVAKDFSAVAYYFGKDLHQSLKVPVGIIHLAVGGSPTEAWIRPEALTSDKQFASLLTSNWLDNEQLEPWCQQRARENLVHALQASTAAPQHATGPNHPFKPGFLWQAGVAQLIPFPIRGVIWYQGESNALELRRVKQHNQLFPLLVADWRKQWGSGDFPFLYCQLSSIGTEKGYRSHYWPEFRNQQRQMLATLPNSGMAVTSDLGHPTDVHPRNKKEVGRRLALWALASTYNQKLVYSGPLAKTVQREGSALIVTFEHAHEGLTTSDGNAVTGCEIAGDDGIFLSANTEIGTNTLTLTHKQIKVPVAVRYNWQPFAVGNLTNAAKLPASTFSLRSDRLD